MTAKQYDSIKLKDGRVGVIVEILGENDILVDVGSSPSDWETITVTAEDVCE